MRASSQPAAQRAYFVHSDVETECLKTRNQLDIALRPAAAHLCKMLLNLIARRVIQKVAQKVDCLAIVSCAQFNAADQVETKGRGHILCGLVTRKGIVVGDGECRHPDRGL